jgi:hypothetical protein
MELGSYGGMSDMQIQWDDEPTRKYYPNDASETTNILKELGIRPVPLEDVPASYEPLTVKIHCILEAVTLRSMWSTLRCCDDVFAVLEGPNHLVFYRKYIPSVANPYSKSQRSRLTAATSRD